MSRYHRHMRAGVPEHDIDRVRFTELWIEYMDKLLEEARAMLALRKIYFLAPPG